MNRSSNPNRSMTSLSKRVSSELAKDELNHYYMVHLVSDKPLQCAGTRCCGTMKDVESILERYPYSRVEKHYFPDPPQTIDVSSVTMAPDPQLPEQRILPQSELQELFS